MKIDSSPNKKAFIRSRSFFIAGLLLVVFLIVGCEKTVAQSEYDKQVSLNAELQEKVDKLDDLETSFASLEDEYLTLELTYVPEKRAQVDTQYQEKIALACAEAIETYKSPISSVIDGYVASSENWLRVYTSDVFSAAVDSCSAEQRGQKLKEEYTAAAVTAKNTACDQFVGSSNYAPTDDAIRGSALFKPEWEPYYSEAQFNKDVRACAQSRKPKPVAQSKKLSSGGGTTSNQPGGGCHPNYSPCLPIVNDLDCKDISGSVTVKGADPYRLDADKDGVGCEAN